MTLALTILAHIVDSQLSTVHALQHLPLDRKPLSRADREELALFADLAPMLRRFPGDRVEIRRACPTHRLPALDIALALPDWWMRAAEPFPVLVARWAARGSERWQLPCFPREEAA